MAVSSLGIVRNVSARKEERGERRKEREGENQSSRSCHSGYRVLHRQRDRETERERGRGPTTEDKRNVICVCVEKGGGREREREREREGRGDSCLALCTLAASKSASWSETRRSFRYQTTAGGVGALDNDDILERKGRTCTEGGLKRIGGK
jgi:hypothetical protein